MFPQILAVQTRDCIWGYMGYNNPYEGLRRPGGTSRGRGFIVRVRLRDERPYQFPKSYACHSKLYSRNPEPLRRFVVEAKLIPTHAGTPSLKQQFGQQKERKQQKKTCLHYRQPALRVPIWYILGLERGSYVVSFGPKYIPYRCMDPKRVTEHDKGDQLLLS